MRGSSSALVGCVSLVGAGYGLIHGREGAAPKIEALLFLRSDSALSAKAAGPLRADIAVLTRRGVRFRALFPDYRETPSSVRDFALRNGLGVPAQLDLGAQAARSLGVASLPSFVLLDSRNKLVGSGPLLSAEVGGDRRSSILFATLSAALAGKPPPTAKDATSDPLRRGPRIASAPTYSKDIAPMLKTRCIRCHADRAIAPFSLDSYAQARKWAPMIVQATQSRTMPPWKAVHGYNEFADENRLLELEIAALKRWADGGAVLGDPKAAEPATRVPGSAWPLGRPDVVLKVPKPYKLYAEGKDKYRVFVFPTEFKKEVYLRGVAARPSNPRIVHHAIVYLDENGMGAEIEKRESDGMPGYDRFGAPGFLPDNVLGGWAPGWNPYLAPEGSGWVLKPGSSIVVSAHMVASGKEEVEQLEIGLYFASTKPKTPMLTHAYVDQVFKIPAGEPRFRMRHEYEFDEERLFFFVYPHMHLVGRTMRAYIREKDGVKTPVILVDDWDFRWQPVYRFKTPLRVDRGATLVVEAEYDNSEANPRNPNRPPKTVRAGDKTSDEMFLFCLLGVKPTSAAPRR